MHPSPAIAGELPQHARTGIIGILGPCGSNGPGPQPNDNARGDCPTSVLIATRSSLHLARSTAQEAATVRSGPRAELDGPVHGPQERRAMFGRKHQHARLCEFG